MNYIDRINQLKKERGLTNADLAKATEIPNGTLTKMLAGYSESPKLSYIVAIATFFNVSLDYLISGIEENHNNYTLEPEEIKLVERYRALTSHSKDLVRVVVAKEYELVEEAVPSKIKSVPKRSALIREMPEGFERRIIPLFDLPVSAGPGEYLGGDTESSETIKIKVNAETATASYAVKVNGNSMEPKFKNGDILFVEEASSVEYGELGIFILDGQGYFKRFGGDRLISLNPEYGDILLDQFESAVCCGRVLGKMKRR